MGSLPNLSVQSSKVNVQVASYNIAANELKIKSPTLGKLDKNINRVIAGDHLDLALWLEKSLSPSPDLIAIGFQELLPQTSARLLSIPTEQSLFLQNKSLSLNEIDSESPYSSTTKLSSSIPSSSTIRLGSQNIAGLEGWLVKLKETISRIHGIQVRCIPLVLKTSIRALNIIQFGPAEGLV
jgi:hypothetical protein